MRKVVKVLILGFVVYWLFFIVCPKNQATYSSITGPIKDDRIYYAKGFQIKTYSDFTLVKIKNPLNKCQTLKTYILISDWKNFHGRVKKGQIVIKIPLKKVVCFSSVICGGLNALKELQTITGVTDPQYIPIPFMQKCISDGTICNIGPSSNPSLEKLLLLSPNAILMNPIDMKPSIAYTKIPVLYFVDYMETHPLGQAEWIRLLGLLFNKREIADSLFFKTVYSYNKLKISIDKIKSSRPSVFTELPYGEIWYVPGGKSYMAQLLQDAGADYFYKNDSRTGAIPLSFETVLYRAKMANIWLIKYHSPKLMTYRQLAIKCSNYTLFDAYKSKNIYACNTLKDANYYQEVFLHPDKLLKEMIILFHSRKDLDDKNFFYKKLRN